MFLTPGLCFQVPASRGDIPCGADLRQTDSFVKRAVRQAGAQASPVLKDVLRKSLIASHPVRLRAANRHTAKSDARWPLSPSFRSCLP
jgi:hypothetical protein